MKKECLFIDVFTDRQMQLLASEINYSEITFITKRVDADFSLRIFTPGMELPFAGHPTLGTAYAIATLLRWWSPS